MSNAKANVVMADDLLVALDYVWSDDHGIGVRGWIFSTKARLEDVRLRVGDTEVLIANWQPRPDVGLAYPQHQHLTENCGFQVYLPRQAQHEFTFQAQRQGETVSKPLSVAAFPHPTPQPYTDGSGLFNEFIEIVNQQHLRVLEIGSRAVCPGNTGKRGVFPGAQSYTGFDYYKDENTDVVGDAHKLSQYFGDQRFDAIFSHAVFEHLAMPWVVAMEINNLLEVGGLTYHVSHFAWPIHETPWDFWRFSDEGLKALFSPALGFEVIKAGLFSPMRVYLDQVVSPQEMLPYYPAFGGVAILAKKVAEIDTNKFRWETNVAEVVGRDSHYPPKA
jgi:hypothetical protein